MDKRIYSLINDQINAELYSAYLYMHFADLFEERGLAGFANWYTVQSKEEYQHAVKFIDYLHESGEPVILTKIDGPQLEAEDIEDILNAGLSHEMYITELINKIYFVAEAISDYRTMRFLDWFIDEQTEEEQNAGSLISKYSLFGGDSFGLYLLNQELAMRE